MKSHRKKNFNEVEGVVLFEPNTKKLVIESSRHIEGVDIILCI